MNQHYVPKVYLKNFAEKIGKTYQVEVYDMNENRHFRTNTEGICAIKDFYTLDRDSKFSDNIYSIESTYSETIEPLYEKCYELLTNDNLIEISPYERAIILIGVFQLVTRNPVFLENMLKYYYEEVKLAYDNSEKISTNVIYLLDEEIHISDKTFEIVWLLAKSIITRFFKEYHLKGLFELSNRHKDVIIQVDKISDDSVFITSDNPAVYHDILDRNSSNRLLQRTITFYMPINPQYAVSIFYDSRKRSDLIYRKYTRNVDVCSSNEKIYKQANRFVISSPSALSKFYEMKEKLENLSQSEMVNIFQQLLELGPHPDFDPSANSDEVISLIKQVVEYAKYNGSLPAKEWQTYLNKIGSLTRKDIIDFTK